MGLGAPHALQDASFAELMRVQEGQFHSFDEGVAEESLTLLFTLIGSSLVDDFNVG